MELLDAYLIPQLQIELYKYNNWYSLCELYQKGVKCAVCDQLWRPIYLKYFPKNKDPFKNYFVKFINKVPKRLDKYHYRLMKYTARCDDTLEYQRMIYRFVQCDEYSLIKFLLNIREYVVCHPYNKVIRTWVINYTTNELRYSEEISTLMIRNRYLR